MKKLMLTALVAGFFTASFAQDDVVKQILKVKEYNEAAQMLNSNLSTMNAEQKAKSYNKLVELSLKTAQKEIDILANNEVAAQTGGQQQSCDSVVLYNSVYDALAAAYKCDKFDNEPNDKGKVKAKFHKDNQTKLYALRGHLINAGIFYQEKGDIANAHKFLSGYVDSADEPLFAEFDKSQDPNLVNISYFAAIFAYQNKDKQRAIKYADIAAQAPERSKDAINLKLAVMQEGLTTKADSLAYMNTLEEIYNKDTNNEQVFGTLVSMYSSLDMETEMNKLFDSALAKDPNNFTVWAVKGQNAMQKQELDKAIEYYKKALSARPDNAQIHSFLGACLLDRASQAEDKAAGKTGRVPEAAKAQIIPIFEDAKIHLEKAKELDPQREQSNWAYALYRCYYRLYGAKDQRTIDAELDTK